MEVLLLSLFEVARLGSFVFEKSSDKKLFTITFVVRCLKGFGWNNVGPASQSVAQHYFTIGPMYRAVRIVAFWDIKRHPYGSHSKHYTCLLASFNNYILDI